MKCATFFSCYVIFNYDVFFRSPDQSLVAQLRGEVEELRRQLRQSVAVAADSGPTIFVITPTYARPVQIGRPENQYYVGFFICLFSGPMLYLLFLSSCVARFVFLRDVWIRTQRAALASRCVTNLATNLPNKLPHLPGTRYLTGTPSFPVITCHTMLF